MTSAPSGPQAGAAPSRLPGLTAQIFIGLAVGVVLGALWPSLGVEIKPLADLFLRMIKMIIAPLLFSTLVVGIAGTGDLRAMGRIGVKAIVWFELATTVALVIGLVLVNVLQPGAGVTLPASTDTAALTAMARQQQTGWDILLHMVPTSVVDAMAKGDILQVVVFASFFGVALAAVGERGAPVVALLDSIAQVMFRFTGYVMRFAPIGVMAAIAATVGGKGLGILVTLGKLVLTMYAGLVLFVLLVVVRRRGGVPSAVSVVHPRDSGAVPHRLHHGQQRGRAAQIARSDGAVWRAEADRQLRVADRLQLQPGRLDAVPVGRGHLRGAARRHRAQLGPATRDDADA